MKEFKLEKGDLVKLRIGDCGIIKEITHANGNTELCVCILFDVLYNAETRIPLKEYHECSPYYNRHWTTEKGYDPRDIVAVCSDGGSWESYYMERGNAFFKDKDMLWTWEGPGNIALKAWNMVLLRNGNVAIVQDYKKEDFNSSELQLYIQIDSKNSYRIDFDTYQDFEYFEGNKKITEYDIVAVCRKTGCMIETIKDYFNVGTKKFSENHTVEWDWKDEGVL